MDDAVKVVLWKNESGDETKPLMVLDGNPPEEVVRKTVCALVGDDYDKEWDHLCGHYWVEEIGFKLSETT